MNLDSAREVVEPLPFEDPGWGLLTWGYRSDLASLRAGLNTARERLERDDLRELWGNVFNMVNDGQGCFESAALAAVPHMLAIQREFPGRCAADLLSFVGFMEVSEICLTGVSDELAANYRATLQEIRRDSLGWVGCRAHGEYLPEVLQGFSALRHPQLSATTAPRACLDQDELELEGPCPACSGLVNLFYVRGKERVCALLHERRVMNRVLGDWQPVPPDPTGYSARLAAAALVLDSSSDPQWEPLLTADVLAVLADRAGDANLSENLLAAFAPFPCPGCGQVLDPRSRLR